MTVSVDGIDLTLSDGTGAPAQGDALRFNSYEGIGQRLGLSAAINNDIRAIAAGQGASPGDNVNALALAGLRDAGAIGGRTYEEAYSDLRVGQASLTATVQRAADNETIANDQVAALADQVSGVSLDEEATNLIKYQRAFQASSRVIGVVDELMQSLINMV
jgi:flagellar hook-associated protein 1 FlgK